MILNISEIMCSRVHPHAEMCQCVITPSHEFSANRLQVCLANSGQGGVGNSNRPP